MKNLFIDSNIWLSLYYFTNDDLEQFGKLKELNGKDIKLYIPQQVRDEVIRNREAKLKETFKQFDLKSIKFPAFCKGYDEYEQFSKDYKNILQRFKSWRTKIDADIRSFSLPADKVIFSLFASTELINCEEFVEKAYRRYRIGNPPGKDNKYGDAINWECLLSSIPYGEDIYFISADKDYRSELFEDAINPFLENEWVGNKHSNIHFYNNLVPFLNEHIKSIQLKTEQEKMDLIAELESSPSYRYTHGCIAMMRKYDGWTAAQIEDICAAAENNSQVRWILSDEDVLDFFAQLLSDVKYESLDDCATKRIMREVLENMSVQNMAEAQMLYEAEIAESAEEYFKH